MSDALFSLNTAYSDALLKGSSDAHFLQVDMIL